MRLYLRLSVLALLIASPVLSQDTDVYPTLPGTSIRDYSKPGWMLKDGYSGKVSVYPTLPGTSIRDYSKPGYRIETKSYKDVTAYPTLPGTDIRDYSKSGYRMERDFSGAVIAYPTLRGTDIRDYSRPGYRAESKPEPIWGIIERSALSGVSIDPHAKRIGDLRQGRKNSIIQSRPSVDSLIWSFDIPGKVSK